MKIENTSERRYTLNTIPTRIEEGGTVIGGHSFSIPAAVTGENGKVHGTCEIPDDLLAELLAKDAWTKAVFDSGHLIKVDAEAKPEKVDWTGSAGEQATPDHTHDRPSSKVKR